MPAPWPTHRHSADVTGADNGEHRTHWSQHPTRRQRLRHLVVALSPHCRPVYPVVASCRAWRAHRPVDMEQKKTSKMGRNLINIEINIQCASIQKYTCGHFSMFIKNYDNYGNKAFTYIQLRWNKCMLNAKCKATQIQLTHSIKPAYVCGWM